ncbi:MAG: DUF1269 domain-containing protein [Acidimicrobiia bacterium]|jgi:uncharacterized membrane protein|nr:DUF1269 domain-containing protein [Acidimicrobiia bacterium]MBP8180607.1 DUF1269 domain-containing protein [Acidimicrobiia bacterium]
MSTLTVWKFNGPDTASEVLNRLEGLQKQELIKIRDAALVSWKDGAKRPKTRQLNNLTGMGALDGAFWGMLFGLLFFMPLLGLVIGTATGALTGALSDVGIDDDFINKVKEKVTPGTSALFLLSDGAVADRVEPEFSDLHPELIASNLDADAEAKLADTFG